MSADPRQPDIGARLTFDLSRPGRTACSLPPCDVPTAELPPPQLLRQELNLPELSQVDLVRYFLALSRLNYSVDSGFYPLGSCTMKYNPKVHEELACLPGFVGLHPHQPLETVQGALTLMHDLQRWLAEITGLDAVSLAPAAGAQGELTGILMIKAYLADRGEEGRGRVLVPDSAHGTNPATAAMGGFEVVTVASDGQGNTDMQALASALDEGVAALMLTLPNTLGLFEPNIGRIAEMLHRKGALLYGDGANLNALLGRALFKAILDLFESLLGNANALFVDLFEQVNGGLNGFPSHRASPLQDRVDGVQQGPVPMHLQDTPAAFDGVVLAMVWWIVNQDDFQFIAVSKLHHPFHELRPKT